MAWGSSLKCAWNDKFRMPEVAQLRGGLNKPLQSVFDDAREELKRLEGVSESVSWQGVPWRWTLVYTMAEVPTERALAYLVPDPQRVQMCVPLNQEQIEKLPMKRLKKSIRDGVVHARSVAGVWWPTWDVPTRGALDEVLELVVRKHKMVTASIETVTA
ncbi:MAG: hypothetical protein K2W85_11210 [Phycisphaerales bacterium]|nr:hypothetical protein [Phycisphaerales bacterium]